MTTQPTPRPTYEMPRALSALALSVFLIPLAAWSFQWIELDNDVRGWLPKDDKLAQVLDWSEAHFPSENRVLISWHGSSLTDSRVAAFREELLGTGTPESRCPFVNDVIEPSDILGQMLKRGVETNTALERCLGTVIGPGTVRVSLTDAGRAWQREAVAGLTQLAEDGGATSVDILPPAVDTPLTLGVGDDEEEVTLTLAMSLSGVVIEETPDHDLQLDWPGLRPSTETARKFAAAATELESARGKRLVESVFFVPGSPVAVLVNLSETGTAEKPAMIAAIRAAAERAGVPADDLHMGGSAVVGSELNREVLRTAWNADAPWYALHRHSPLMLTGLVGTVLTLALLRNWKLGAVVLVVGFYATAIAVSLVPVTGGSMNLVLVVMPALMIVLTLSGAIHMANYWQHACVQGASDPVAEATRMARQPCLLAAVTTAIGLASLLASTLVPVRDFGIYSAVGCLIAFVCVIRVLPAMLHIVRPQKPRVEEPGTIWTSIADAVFNRRGLVIAGSLTIAVGCTFGLTRFQTETKVIRYFDEKARVVQDYEFLENRLSGIASVETIVRFNERARVNLSFLERLEIVREVENSIRQHPEVSGTVSLASFLPTFEKPNPKANFLQKARYRKTAQRAEAKIREHAEASRFLADSKDACPLDPHAGSEELWRVSAQVAVMGALNYSDFTNTDQTGSLDERIKSVLGRYAGTNHVATGTVPLFLRTQQAVLDSLVDSFGLAAALIGLVVIGVLRHPAAGLLALIPNLIPVAAVFGLVSWFGITIDIGTMITASIALGIAVDGTLHQITWFREGIRCGLPRRDAVRLSLSHCGPAMTQTSLVVGLGLLVLAPAPLTLISRFGWLMALLILAALLSDLVLLTALLSGPLGKLVESTESATEPTTDGPENPIAKPHWLTRRSRDGSAVDRSHR